jgi:predicted helicase
MKPEHYENYDGICLTDTFQLNEHGDNDIFSQLFPENSERLKKQKNAPVRVIIGNPPYSVGQNSANDNAQNLKYPHLDKRVADTYAANTNATNKNSLYDSYIKAFRWASDRIAQLKEGGIVAFISNGAWIDGNAQDGMRKCLQDEFTSIYVFNLRGNARTSGEQRRKESGNVFGEGTRTPITITLLVKNPVKKQENATIHYHDIGDYLTRNQKLDIIKRFRSVRNIEWKEILPNEKSDWINQRDGFFDTLIPITGSKQSVFTKNIVGLTTARDAWDYNSSISIISDSIKRLIEFFNIQRKEYQIAKHKEANLKVEDFISSDQSKISWTRFLRRQIALNRELSFDENEICIAMHRPFFKQQLYYSKDLVESPGQYKQLLSLNPPLFCVSTSSNKAFCCLMVQHPVDYDLVNHAQCYPPLLVRGHQEKAGGSEGEASSKGRFRRCIRPGFVRRILQPLYPPRRHYRLDS